MLATYGAAVSDRARLEESRDEQLNHAAGIVARIIVGTNAEVADAVHQFEASISALISPD